MYMLYDLFNIFYDVIITPNPYPYAAKFMLEVIIFNKSEFER